MKETSTKPWINFNLLLTGIFLLLIIPVTPFYAGASNKVIAFDKKSSKKNYGKLFAKSQIIKFDALVSKQYGDADFDPGAVATSGLKVQYQSTNTAVATIVNGKVHIVAAGPTTIIASQPGNTEFAAATRVYQNLDVSRAPLTIKASNKTRQYGSTNPAFTYEYTGFVNNDTDAKLTKKPTATTTAVAKSPVGDYTITAGGASSSKYVFTYVSGTLTIEKAPLLIKADDKAKAYGTAVPALTLTYTGFKNGEKAATALQTQASVSAPYINAYTTPGVYPEAINVANATAQNYEISFQSGTFTVTKASLKITAANKTKTYGAANPAFTVTYTGFAAGESVNNLTGALTGPITEATEASPVGNYPIIVSGNFTSDNYNISYASGILTIGKAQIKVTPSNLTKVYGDDNPTSFPIVYSGFVNGDTEGILTVKATASTNATKYSPAGKYNIVATGASTANPNYAVTYVNGSLTIGKASLTVSIANATRVYGEANPAFSIIDYSGFVGNDKASVITKVPTLTTTATPQSNAGTYAITGVNAAAANYNFVYKNGVLTVTKATLKVKANNATRTYGATTAPYTFTYTGFLFSDNDTKISTKPGIVSTATVNSPVGTYPIKPSGAVSTNYNFIYEDGGMLTITKAPLTIKPADKARMYGYNNPALTATYSGLKNNETAATALTKQPALSTTADLSSVMGTYPIIAAGAEATNYEISYFPGTLTVTKALLTVKAANVSTTYGKTTPPALDYQITGFVNGDTKAVISSGSASLETPTFSTTSPVGRYDIKVTGDIVAPNYYEVKYANGIITVTKAILQVAVQNATKVYGQENPVFTATYSGFVNGDAEAAIADSKPVLSSTATAASPAGKYAITGTGTAQNYIYAYNKPTLTVTPASLTITPKDAKRGVGQPNPAFEAVYEGFVNNDTEASLATKPTYTTNATDASPMGDYNIFASGAASPNYTITYNEGKLTIGKAVLTVIANAQAKVYGEANPALTYTYSGFLNGDNESVLTSPVVAITTATTVSPAGIDYPITLSGGASAKYDIEYKSAVLTVKQAKLTVTANNASKIYGAENPAFTAKYSGFVNGDTEASLTKQPTFTTAATPASPVANYDIIAGGATSTNYELVYTKGTLTVNKAPLTIAADNISRVYGVANPAFSARYYGFVNGDTEASLTTKPYFNTTATLTSTAADYPITVSGAVAANYDITYTDGVLTVGKVQLLVKANNQSKTYGSDNPALTFTYSGFLNGDTEASLTALPVASTTATKGSAVDEYPITLTGGASAKYDLVYEPAVLTVNKAPLSITVVNQSRKYGIANAPLTATYTGFVNGDTEASLTTKPTLATTADIASPVNTYAITITGANSPNYDITQKAGTLTITKADLNIAAVSTSKTYGAANPAFTASYTGFANGETVNNLTAQPIFTTAATTTSGVGTYPVTVSGAASGNYNITYTQGAVLTVNPAQIIAKADDKAKVYGAANPAFTISYSGFVNGDTESILSAKPVASTLATASSGASTYAINVTGGTAANYTIQYTAGTLTVNKAPLTVKVANASRSFGEANPAFTYTYQGFVNGDTESSITTAPTISTVATATTPAGTYDIVAANAAAANYSFNYEKGTLTILSVARTIVFNQLPVKTYGDAAFDPGAASSTNDALVYTSSNPAIASIVNGRIQINGAGSVIITALLPANPNYAATQPVTRTLTINKATQTISFGSLPVLQRSSTYDLGSVTATSGLPVTFTVNDAVVASVQGNVLTALTTGSTGVVAYQAGNDNYLPANTVVQELTVLDQSGLEVTARQAVSPNGDGENDVFFVEGITSFPNNRVTIVNRNGVKVYEVSGYDNTTRVFDGHSNVTGGMQQEGTYYYIIQYINEKGEGRHLTGYFVMKL